MITVILRRFTAFRSPSPPPAVLRKRVFIGLMLAFLLSFPPRQLQAGNGDSDAVGFNELVVTTSATHLLVFGHIANSFSEEMISGLKSGVPIDFSFFVELFRQNPGESRQMVTELQFRHTLTYDTLKDNYKVELEEFNNKVVSFTELAEAQNTMSEVNGVKLLELSQLTPDSTYRLRIRADLFKQTLPLSLHHILPFLSWWDRETDWHTLEFNY